MIKIFYGSEKTNSYYPDPWAWTTDPFPAFRGAGQRYNAFLAVANGFTPWFSSFNLADNKAMSDDYCKVIVTKKGTRLLVPCKGSEDERILLITARGGFRGGFGVIEGVGAEILWENHMTMHCAPVAHIIARVTDPEGYVRTETGRRSCSGYTEVYSWKGGYFGMDTEEYDAALETGTLFAAHDTILSDLEKCKAKRAEQAASRTARAGFIARLEAVNARIKKASVGTPTYGLGETFFTKEEPRQRGVEVKRFLYTEENVAAAEKKADNAEATRAMRDAEAVWKPQFQAATESYTFTEGKSPWRDPQPEYCSNCVSIWSVAKDKFVRYEYSAEGLAQFKSDIPAYEEEYKEILRKKAEAEAKAKAEAEAAARQAEAEAKAKAEQAKAEEEAKALGLPSDVQIWKRTGSRTGCSKGWVIRPDGSERKRDDLVNEDSRRARRYDEGYEVWRQICVGELVIAWEKAYTAAPHNFEVIYRPETLTEAQLEHVAEIQEQLENEWAGLTGLASHEPSPSIGQGWGLFPRKISEDCLATPVTPDDDEADSTEEGESFGATLGELFSRLFG